MFGKGKTMSLLFRKAVPTVDKERYQLVRFRSSTNRVVSVVPSGTKELRSGVIPAVK